VDLLFVGIETLVGLLQESESASMGEEGGAAQRRGREAPPHGAEPLPQLDGAAADAGRISKNAKKKMKAKERKAEKKSAGTSGKAPGAEGAAAAPPPAEDGGVEIEYVADAMVDEEDPNYAEWLKIFQKFQKPPAEEEVAKEADAPAKEAVKQEEKKEEKKADSDDEDGEGAKEKLSRKKFKLLNRLSIAELKQLVRRPDVVEVWDVTSSDPKLLVFLKSYRNSVPVPRHWCNKRKYLQGKRGIEKSAFQLPDFIEATGIAKMRAAYEEKEAEKSMKQKARAQSRPKMSKMDIDYQVLHDAFFRFQTKPKLTTHGDLYYEVTPPPRARTQPPARMSCGTLPGTGVWRAAAVPARVHVRACMRPRTQKHEDAARGGAKRH